MENNLTTNPTPAQPNEQGERERQVTVALQLFRTLHGPSNAGSEFEFDCQNPELRKGWFKIAKDFISLFAQLANANDELKAAQITIGHINEHRDHLVKENIRLDAELKVTKGALQNEYERSDKFAAQLKEAKEAAGKAQNRLQSMIEAEKVRSNDLINLSESLLEVATECANAKAQLKEAHKAMEAAESVFLAYAEIDRHRSGIAGAASVAANTRHANDLRAAMMKGGEEESRATPPSNAAH